MTVGNIQLLANYAYDFKGNFAFAFACFAATACVVQMFQIGALRRRIDALESERQTSMNNVEPKPGTE